MATKKVGVKVYGIKWDTDGEKVKLPTTTEFKVSDLEQYLDLDEATDEEVADTIGEILTNEYEFCHDGFKWTWLTKKMTPAEAKRAKVDEKVRKFIKKVKAMVAKAAENYDRDGSPADWDDLEAMAYELAK